MLNFDELYYEAKDGQIVMQRNSLTLKFEFLTFIDMDNMLKEKKAKAIKVATSYNNLNNPNILNITKFEVLNTPHNSQAHIVFIQESPDHIQNWKTFCKRPFSTIQILCIFRQLCLALSHFHGQGLIHRDIHPTRINSLNNIVKLNLVGMPYNFKKLLKNDTFCGHL